MKRQDLLVERLKKYRESEMYPFHMPGHKRQVEGFLGDFPNPFSIDIQRLTALIICIMQREYYGNLWTGRQMYTGRIKVIIWSMEAVEEY